MIFINFWRIVLVFLMNIVREYINLLSRLPNITVSQTTGLSKNELAEDPVPVEELQPALEPVPTEVSTSFSPLPPPASSVTEESIGPIRRRKKTPVEIIHHQYEKALKEVNDRGIIAVSLKANGVPKSTFYKWKALAELKILDPEQFRALEEMYSEDSNVLPKKQRRYCKKTSTWTRPRTWGRRKNSWSVDLLTVSWRILNNV